MILYTSDDPQRPPNWRDKNARALTEGGVVSPPNLDRPTRRVVRLQQRLQAAKTFQERTRAIQADPSTSRALELSRPDDSTGLLLRLWLLAGVQVEDVANELRIPLCVAATFVSNHFDICTRLDDPSFIIPQVVLNTAFGCGNSSTFQLLIAFLGGRGALTEMLHFGGRREDRNMQGVCNAIARRQELLRGLKLHLAEEAVDPMDLKAAPEALRILERQEQATVARNEKAPPHTPLEETLDAVLKSVPWSIRGTTDAHPQPLLAPFEGGAAELRADDQLRIVAGESEIDPDEFKSRKLPPPRKSN